MGRREAASIAAAFAAAVAIAATIGPSLSRAQQLPPGAAPGAQATSDPLELFKAMRPVFQHPRCMNCHRAVDPFESELATIRPPNVRHLGGQQARNADCTEGGCHDRVDTWVRANPDHSFHDRSIKEICEQQHVVVQGFGEAGYLNHLANDKFIGEAFAGLAGGARTTPDRPAMSRGEFVRAAAKWVRIGKAGCGSWEGTISRTETFASSYSYPMAGFEPPSRITVNEQAQLSVTVTRTNGDAKVRLTAGGRGTIHQHGVMTGPAGPCTMDFDSIDDWAAQNTAEVPTRVDIQIADDGSYTIGFSTPELHTVTIETGDMVNTCGGAPMHSSDSTPLDWDPRHFVIRCPGNPGPNAISGDVIDCKPYDPRTNPRLTGRMTRTIINHNDAKDPQSWLNVSPIGNSRSDDGASLPVKVVTFWDFAIVN